MDKEERLQLYNQAIAAWGVQRQLDKFMEESSELTKAILKRRWAKSADEVNELTVHVIDEVADCEIIIEQMKNIFGEDAVDEVKEQKLKRLHKILNP